MKILFKKVQVRMLSFLVLAFVGIAIAALGRSQVVFWSAVLAAVVLFAWDWQLDLKERGKGRGRH